ncbi:PAQR family membrane homeostasis protein TrhA [Paenibacillus hamazuiensis]|uniref:PAQR family membrane homeostasis protein TrhA n=1 Tax=Paenibacillus hamazuiensis TaxID=2936508 RepID=UPI00200C2819|nr:hemolysin III family protein [Paenibacillus hamazuiensis]
MEKTHLSKEECANIWTHGAAALLSVVALAMLLQQGLRIGSFRHMVSFGVFGASLVLVYSSSTLLHRYQKNILELLDHAAIYLLIAATQTPFLLITLHDRRSMALLALVWSLSLAGIAVKVRTYRSGISGSVLYYAAVCWTAVFAVPPLHDRLPPAGFGLLLGGVLLYMFGVIFYIWRKIPYHHAIWHLFVAAGSAAHFFAVLRYVR